MKKVIILVFAILLFTSSTYANNYIEKTVDGYKFRVIRHDVKNEDFVWKVGVKPDYGASSLREIMDQNNGISAVNGVFFCPADYKECRGQDTTKNERYYKGFKIFTTPTTENRVVFAVDKNGKPFLFQTDNINSGSEGKIYYGLSNFPLLLRDGESTYDEYLMLGLIDKKMKSKLSRNFVCSDNTKRYIYSGYISAIELEKLPEVLSKFGCYNALNLDAGASASLIYNGRQVLGPGRDILDAIVIERKGLNTAIINQNIKDSVEKVRKKLDGKTYEEKVLFINNISDALNEMRQKIYDKNSFNTFDEKGQINGYEIYVKNLTELTNIYLINYLNRELNILKNDFKNEEDARIKRQIKEKNNEKGLF